VTFALPTLTVDGVKLHKLVFQVIKNILLALPLVLMDGFMVKDLVQIKLRLVNSVISHLKYIFIS
jgi:hypothetical protein